jgi:hypothetical protein
MVMYFLYLFGGLVAVFIMYKLLSYNLYRRMSTKFIKSNLDAFKKEFGTHSHFRNQKGGLHRHRWRKGLVVVKATFDSEGKIICTRMQPFRFFALHTEIIFLDR